MKKLLITALLLSLTMFAFAGGQSDSSKTSGVTELQLWHRWSGANEKALDDVVAAFMAENPDVVIETTAKPGEYMELLQKMIADVAAGNNPPELFVGGYNLMNYIYTEMEPTLIDKIAPSNEAYKALSEKFLPAIYNLGKINNDQIGLPFALSNIVMFYNEDLFEAAGLTSADVPQTWDDVIRVGKIIKEKTGKFAVGMQKVDSWPDLGIIFSNGGEILSEDGTKVAFDNPEAVEAVSMWQSLHQLGLAPINTDAELMANFIAGDVAMYVASCMKLASIRSSTTYNLGVVECPSFGSKVKALPAGGAAIMSFTKDKSKYDAIWKFLNYAIEQEAMGIFTQTGYLCVSKVEVPMTEGQEAAYNQLQYAVPWTAWPGGSAGLEIDRLYINKRLEIIHGSLDVKSTFEKLVEDCNSLLR